jgi:RNA polymerase sigma-70 factor (ECF subfamily)
MIETDIIERCQRGDVSAFEKIYNEYHQPMLRVAVRMLGRQQDAEDAVQTTFIKLYRGIGKFRFQSRFSTFLFQIHTRVCFDAIRSQKRHAAENIENIIMSTEQSTDLKIGLEHAIAELPERMRLCFTLFAIEEFKQDEIAEIMNMTSGGVKSTLYQARKRLQKFLSEQ